MNKTLLSSLFAAAILAALLLPSQLHAASATLGNAVPDVSLTGAAGKTHALSDYKGKFIVLEWTNPDCPFVHKFYDSDTMQKLQKDATDKGVIWLRVNSAGAGHEGFQTATDAAAYEKSHQVNSTATLLDPTGTVGHTFGATNTPQLFVINAGGVLVYAGGIDNKPSPNPETIKTAKNYVTAALVESMAGKPVSTPSARPYGCAVKYAD